LLACNRVAELILETAGGELEGEAVDAIAGHVVRHSVWLRRTEILRLLGQEISDAVVSRILTRLGFGLNNAKGWPVIHKPSDEELRVLKLTLKAMGFDEAISPSFISPADAQAFASSVAVPLANPLSEEQSMMRTSLLPGMLGMLAWNLNRGTTDVRMFEMGHVFVAPAEEQTQESK